MKFTKSALAAVAAVLAGVAIGIAAPASAEPAPPPGAPKKPAETWLGQPVIWWDGDATPGGKWGVFVNGQFLELS